MAYDFFFSYPRSADNAYMEKFYNELEDMVRQFRGKKKDEPVGFIDQQDLERGSDWPEELKNALQTSKVMVALYCPAYFNSAFCRKELRVFDLRQRQYERQMRAAGRTYVAPNAIKPVPWWSPFTVPPDLAHLQYQTGAAGSIEEKGLFFARKKGPSNEKYTEYVRKLASEISDICENYDLPPLADFPPLRDMDEGQEVVTTNVDEEGAKHVKFVYIALRSDEAKALREQLTAYGPRGRAWKPFLPDVDRGIGPIAQAVAGEYDFTSDELTFSPDLPREIQRAEDRGNVVLILMDGWSVRVGTYFEVLRDLDRLRLANCGILVPWNLNDPETASARDTLAAEVRQALRRWSADENPVHFNDAITSPDDLRKHLGVTLGQLQVKAAMAARPGIAGKPKPTITNR